MKKILLSLVALFAASTLLMQAQTQDPAVYPLSPNGIDSLANLFLNATSNVGGSIFPGGVTGDARGMTVTNNKMYFSNRTTTNPVVSSLVEVDGVTGAFLRNIVLPIDMWMEGTPSDTVPYLANDVQVDEQGNIFVSNMVLDLRGNSGEPAHTFKINYVNVDADPVTYETVLNAVIPADWGLAYAYRVETFDVYGDILNGDGTILVPVSGTEPGAGDQVLKYNVVGGVVQNSLDPEFVALQGFYPTTVTTAGAAPRVNIVDNTLFYHDGFNTYPSLYDMTGNVVDGFQNNVAATPLGTGQNGITEFEMNGKYYMIVASTNTDKTPPQAFDIFQFADANRSFADMTFLYRFPEAGLGNTSNPVRTALPRVQVIDVGGVQKARINVYAYRNGYGIYEFGPTQALPIGEQTGSSFGATVKGYNVEFTQEVLAATLFNVSGQKVKEVTNTKVLSAPAKGVYIVKAKLADGTEKAVKVLVK